jgi:DNA-directed RNA polymerase specialized sigma24 family protein
MQVVLRRLVIDRLRRRRTSRLIFSERVDQVAVETQAAPWWHDLEVDTVEGELAHLPSALRDTFRMFCFEARDYKQIARQQNVAIGTVGARISRARALLRQRLSERGAATTASPHARRSGDTRRV